MASSVPLSSLLAALRTQINDPVCGCNEFQPVFHHKDGISLGYQTAKQGQEGLDIPVVKTCGGLIQDVDIAGLLQFTCQLQPLGFAAGQGTGGLPQGHVSQANLLEGLQGITNLLVIKEIQSLFYRQPHNLLNIQTMKEIGQSCGIETSAAALLAGNSHGIRKGHIRGHFTPPLTGRTGPLGVGAEPLGTDAVFFGKKLADPIHDAGIGGRGGADGGADGVLVYYYCFRMGSGEGLAD